MVKPSQIRDPRHHDSVGSARVRRHLIHGSFIAVVAIVLVGGLVWAVFWSPWVRITVVDTSGVPAAIAGDVRTLADGKNALFLDTRSLAAAIAHQFPLLASVSVQRILPHRIIVTASTRIPVGIWCKATQCQYWDASGARWGDALPSTGPLLLNVDDQRPASASAAFPIAHLLEAVHGLPAFGLAARTVSIPDAEPGGLRIHTTAGYDILMDAQGAVADQLATLGVFLANHAKDPVFAPQYIDLRTPGRVYWK